MFRIDVGSCKEWSCISCFDYEQKLMLKILVILYLRVKFCVKIIDIDGIRTRATEVTGA